jgi:multicomponent Na+:H+ antiporter subunit A
MGEAVGSYRISTIVATGDWLRAHPDYPLMLALVLAGAFTKSAQFPFHFWLPNAMAAPTPVSAYLHSATMVKAGIYLLARLHPALAGTEPWLLALTVAGGITAVHAAVQSLRQTDLKLALAYTTLVALGLLTMFLAADAALAMVAALTFIVVHALYKSALFLVIGIVDHECGTRDVRRLGGLARAMPVTAAACALAALSMAGFPPFLGFIGKELKYEGALAIYDEPALAVAAVLTANALVTALAGILVLRVFFGGATVAPRPPHEAPLAMWLGPATLATLGLVLGMMPELIGAPLIQAAVTEMLGRPEPVKLALWHGFNVPLALSVATFAAGAVLFLLHRRFVAATGALARSLRLNADRAYDAVLAGALRLAAWQTALIQGSSLNRWLAATFTIVAISLGALLPGALPPLEPSLAGADALDFGLALLIALGAAATLAARSRLFAVCALGIVGVGVALVFLTYSAVDVAMTQLLVETLVLVIVALLMPRLPPLASVPGRGWLRALRDGTIALGMGAVAAALAYAASRGPLDRELTAFFDEQSVPGGHGRNIVNVILVDFRAIDTFGEVAVVVIAALAAFALLRGVRRGGSA